MGEKVLELKIMSCKDLTAFNLFQKLNVFALVSIVNDENNNHEDENLKEIHNLNKLQEQKTPTDTEGDANPEWNHEMKFDLSSIQDLNDDRLFLHFDLHSDVNSIILAVAGDRCIGHVWVPLKDLIQSPNIVRFVNYEVRSLDGKPNGVINFSFKFVSNFKQHDDIDSSFALPNINVNGYPIHHQNHSAPSNVYPPPSPSSEIPYPPSNSQHSEANSPHCYYEAVSTPVTPYSPQQGYVHHHHHQHPFSPLRPYPPVTYPPPPPQPELYVYPPPHQNHEYHQEVSCPNWAHYPPHPPDPHHGVANGSDYFQSPSSAGTPFNTQTTTWPGYYPPVGDHFSPSWDNRPHM